MTYPDTQDYDRIDEMMQLLYGAVTEVADVPVIATHNGPISLDPQRPSLGWV